MADGTVAVQLLTALIRLQRRARKDSNEKRQR
jgi:hypothetical protein